VVRIRVEIIIRLGHVFNIVWITISLGKNPARGGSPAKERILIIKLILLIGLIFLRDVLLRELILERDTITIISFNIIEYTKK